MKLITLFYVVLMLAFQNGNGQLSLTLIGSGFIKPVDIKNAGDVRIFVVEQAGYIRIMDTSGNVKPQPFLDIHTETAAVGEQGLLGLAFSPDYKNNGRFYINYTDLSGNSHICRYTVSQANPDSADPASKENIFYVVQPFANHNGGDLEFGGDGYLYCAFGDGGNGGDPGNRAQNLHDTLGKILRIDVDVPNGYRIPTDNPFYGDTAAIDEIWAYGVRNPWRNSFDRITHDYWIADVGQGTREEVNFQPASSNGGENYGWRCYEGSLTYNTTGCGPISDYVFPVAQFAHQGSTLFFYGCSVTGGYVYRGARYNYMFGKYFCSDYCNNRMYSLTKNDTGFAFVQETLTIWTDGFAAFGEDIYGEIYVAGNSSGKIYRLDWNNDCTPVAFITFEDTIKACNGTANLTALYHPGLTYQWKRDGQEIVGAVFHQYTANLGSYYSVVVSNDTCISESDPVYIDKVAFITFEDTIKACSGTAILTAHYYPEFKYQWKRDGKEISGAVSYQYTADLAGYYSVVVSNDTCISESDPVYLDNCIRIENNVVVAPNPSFDEINLLIRSAEDMQATVELYDIEGRLCLSKIINLYPPYSEKYKISIANLSAGLYIIKVNTVEFTFQDKIIVIKSK
ncbi:MAG: PQQ-dependent sugar dehydrogenase [Bacteroidia bacterium]